jgi:cephalosporin hydroxylase
LEGLFKMNEIEKFKLEVQNNISGLANDKDIQALSRIWIREIARHKWAYNFTWMGRPAIQFPNDAWALQEIIWEVRPDLIIETGIAHGGSLVFSASMLALLDVCDSIEAKRKLDPNNSQRRVLGIDVDIRSHNREAINAHPMSSRIQMIQGSSIDVNTVEKVYKIASHYSKILVCLDSNHTHEHVLAELNAYAPLVSKGSYCIVFDTIIEDMPIEISSNRPWAPGNNPKTAVREFLKSNPEFEINKSIDHKILISVAPDGFLKRVN